MRTSSTRVNIPVPPETANTQTNSRLGKLKLATQRQFTFEKQYSIT